MLFSGSSKSCLSVLSLPPLGVCHCSMGSIDGLRYPATRWVQRHAAHFVKKIIIIQPGLLHELSWLPLFERRKHSRLTVFYEAFNNLSAISLDHLSVSSRHTRASNENKFMSLPVRTNAFKYSFFPQTITVKGKWRGSRFLYGGDSTLTPPTGNVALVTDDLVVSLRSGIWLEVEDSSLGSGITRLPRRYPCWPRVAISSWQDWSWFAEHDVYLIIEGLI